MSSRWIRYWSITIGGIVVSSDTHDAEFDLTAGNDTDSNGGEIVLWNLAPSSRAAIAVDAEVTVEAGYVGDHGLIFAGTVAAITDEVTGGDTRTMVEVQDTMQTLYQATSFVKTYTEGTPASTIAEDMFAAGGIPVGEIQDPGVVLKRKRVFEKSPYENLQTLLTIINGDPSRGGTRPADIADRWTFYVEGGSGYVVPVTYGSTQTAVISSETGLMAVTPLEDDEKKGYTVDVLLLWPVRAGTRIALEGRSVTGTYVVTSYTHTHKEEEYMTSLQVVTA